LASGPTTNSLMINCDPNFRFVLNQLDSFNEKKVDFWTKHIAFLQESHLTDAEDLKLKRDWVGEVFYSSYNSSCRGVVILSRNSTGRWIILKCHINQEPFTLINIYGPNNDDALFSKDILLAAAQIYGKCIMAGDYNLTLI
uniref:Endonuclease/exonuclease/phosphatase domain-containing protein n=1 Tax=Labrus bergylta TaxID=56723 RepID=A0A3Q3FA80_9LABR